MSSTVAFWPSTRRAHSRLKSSRLWPMRVPPAQSLHVAGDLGDGAVGIAALQRARDVGQPGAEQEGRDAVARVGHGVEEVQHHAGVGVHAAGDVAQHDQRRRAPAPRLEVQLRRDRARARPSRAARGAGRCGRTDRDERTKRRVGISSRISAMRWMAARARACSAALICSKSLAFSCSSALQVPDMSSSMRSSGCDLAASAGRPAAARAGGGRARLSWARSRRAATAPSPTASAAGSSGPSRTGRTPGRRSRGARAARRGSRAASSRGSAGARCRRRARRAVARITRSGPTGSPAERSSRANCRMFSAIRPPSTSAAIRLGARGRWEVGRRPAVGHAAGHPASAG